MKVYRGTTADTAFKVEYKPMEAYVVEQFASKTIDEIFGKNDGDYLIMNVINHPAPSGKQYKIYLVEDCDKQTHQIFFELVRVSGNPNPNSYLH